VDVALLVALSKALGPLTLTGNGGYTFVTRNRALDFWTLTASVEHRVARAWGLVGEIVSTLGESRAVDTVVLRAGAVYAISDRIRLDGAAGFGLTRGSPDVLLTIGTTFDLF